MNDSYATPIGILALPIVYCDDCCEVTEPSPTGLYIARLIDSLDDSNSGD